MLGIWLLSCLLLSAAYAGKLKGFLTNPGLTRKIETLQQVFESELPYYWNDHGIKMALGNHPNPDVEKLIETRRQIPGAKFQKEIYDKVRSESFLSK